MKIKSLLLDSNKAIPLKKVNKHIEIVSSTITSLGSMSEESRQAIYEVLKSHYTNVGITIVDDLKDLEKLVSSKPDVVFLGMKYLPLNPDEVRGSDKVWLSSYLARRGIACTGSDYNAHSLEIDKPQAKQRVLDAGLKTSPYFVIKQNAVTNIDTPLPFPLFVKPTDRGGGAGIDSGSVVYNLHALRSKVQSIKQALQADSLVEQYLPGREFSVAILKNESSNTFSTSPIELVTDLNKNGTRILSSAVKQDNLEIVSVVNDKGLHDQLCTLALATFHALGAQDYGRIDIRLDTYGVPNFLEANLIPSLIQDYGSFPKACMLNIQLDYKTMILNIVKLALKRQDNMEQDKVTFNLPRIITPPLLSSTD